jgi:hypothetical protein
MTTPLQHTSLGELGYTPLLATSLGELGSTTIAITPGGGLSDAMDLVDHRMRNLRKRTQRNIRHMLLLSSVFVAIKEDSYERREEDETGETD